MTIIVASCRPGQAWTERRSLTDPRALVELDVAALAGGVPTRFGILAAEGVVLVCTHGHRDVCCARLGRPIAALLDAQLPGQVWESTHVGGHRFAPTIVALPDGSYHGAVTVTDVPALAKAVTSGRVLLPRLRGRAGLPAAVQAADLFLRQQTGQSVLDAITVVAVTPGSCGEVHVELQDGAQRWCVRVTSRLDSRQRLTSCLDSGTGATPAVFELVSLERLA